MTNQPVPLVGVRVIELGGGPLTGLCVDLIIELFGKVVAAGSAPVAAE